MKIFSNHLKSAENGPIMNKCGLVSSWSWRSTIINGSNLSIFRVFFRRRVVPSIMSWNHFLQRDRKRVEATEIAERQEADWAVQVGRPMEPRVCALSEAWLWASSLFLSESSSWNGICDVTMCVYLWPPARSLLGYSVRDLSVSFQWACIWFCSPLKLIFRNQVR